jgi:LmbE family N-acetylglucosaminyl deacetylase
MITQETKKELLSAYCEKKDVLIFAPHPDDETLGCAGVIMEAKRSGKKPGIVVCTNGDGFVTAASVFSGKEISALSPEDFLEVARARQKDMLNAMQILGLSQNDIVFLGYPDGGLARMFSTGTPYMHQFTQKNCTYGLIMPDYHSLMFDVPAPYLRSAIREDMIELLQKTSPREIYVTHFKDGHSDHRECFYLVGEAVAKTGFKGEIFAYLIHSADGNWPLPRGANPQIPFEAQMIDGIQCPTGVSWPPDERRPLRYDEAEAKLKAIHSYTLEMKLASCYIESFVKNEEVFWKINDIEILQKMRPSEM